METSSISIEPRVSALEAGQQALHRDVMSLSGIVKEQGVHLSTAIDKLADIHTSSFSQLSDKVNAVGKTDWTTFWTMIMCILLLLTAVSTPVWITFTGVDKQITKHERSIDILTDQAITSIKERAEMRAKQESQSVFVGKNETNIERLNNIVFIEAMKDRAESKSRIDNLEKSLAEVKSEIIRKEFKLNGTSIR